MIVSLLATNEWIGVTGNRTYIKRFKFHQRLQSTKSGHNVQILFFLSKGRESINTYFAKNKTIKS